MEFGVIKQNLKQKELNARFCHDIKLRYTEIALIALNKGAEPCCIKLLGTTLLHYCVDEDALALAQALVKRGLDPNAQNEKGETPLKKARVLDNKRMIEYFSSFIQNNERYAKSNEKA